MITTCKGRLHHLRQTLPLMIDQKPDELIVVDYDCPDGAGDWVEATYPKASYPNIKVVRVKDAPEFSAPRARNIGVRNARAQWLAFVDADVRTDPQWGPWMRQNLRPGNSYRADKIGERRDPETFGTLMCARRDFIAISGFDEALVGWSGENYDLLSRLGELGLNDAGFPPEFLDPIRHGDDQRASFEGMAGKDERTLLVICYTQAKRQLKAVFNRRGNLALEGRNRLRETILARLKEWQDAGQADPLQIRFTFDLEMPQAPERYRLNVKSVIAFDIAVDADADADADGKAGVDV